MSDEIRMMLLDCSKNSLVEAVLMSRGRTAELLARIAELEEENETIISDYEERMDNLVNIGNETGRLLQAEIGYLNAQLDIKNLTSKTLQLRIAELEAAQRWIPVSERLPEDEKTVIVAINDVLEHTNEVARLTYLGNSNWWSWKSERYIVTHWMPLPEPPEVQE